MNPGLTRTVAVLAIAAVVHAGAVHLAPRAVMAVVLHRFATRAGGVNRPYHAPPVTDAAREVVLPSPDLLYSGCSLDLSQGPVEVSAVAPRSYFSLSIFDAVTDNVFVFNDRDARSHLLRLQVYGPGDPHAHDAHTPSDAIQVVVPTNRALLLLRALAVDPRMTADVQTARHSLQCHRLGE